MASRDRYEIEVECPNCGNNGVLKISENDYPFMRSLARQAMSADGNFQVEVRGDIDMKLTCANCSETFIK